jgi:glycine/D-amino acid oxidase-like deaminating enzyme
LAETKTASQASIVVVGGGIVGLATAWQLCEQGVPDVVLYEAEPIFATHASGRNAAIFLPLEESLSAVWLASRSRDLLDARLGTSWLSAQGVTMVAADEDALDELRFAARRFGVFHERWQAGRLHNRLPLLAEGAAQHGLHLPLGGVIDTHHVLTSLRRFAVQAGARVMPGVRVRNIDSQGGKVTGVTLEGGHQMRSERVVLAAGAWAGALGAGVGAKLALTPLRRHLVHLMGEGMPSWKTPAVWRVDVPTYFRPEAGGVLASPCDETPWEPGIPPTDPAALESLAEKLGDLAPALAGSQVRRSWACLRTMTDDREPAIGEDPRVRGLYWLVGMGGRGMSCGVAAGELLARTVVGLSHPLARPLAVNRFIR